MSAQTVKNRPTVYGLTGGIASGKTTAVNFFKEKAVKIFDSDKFVHKEWDNNYELINKIKEKYNIDMSKKEERKKLANIIFNSEVERAYVNSLVHPYVFEGIKKFIEDNENEKFVIIDVPLLFEVGFDVLTDKTILIYTHKRHQVKRIITRDNLTKKEALNRIESQINLKDKKTMATYVINNTGTLDNFKDKLEIMYGVMVNENK